MGSTKIGRLVVATLFALVAVGLTATTSTAAQKSERHCVVEVIGQAGDTLITGPERCYSSEAGAARRVAAATVAPALAPSTGGFSTLSGGTNIIGVHYTSTNFNGSTITIIGTTCGGGVWWPTGFWNNNLESSRHYCGSAPTTFYDSSSCSGTARSIYSAASSLGWMNNRASCVRYG